MIRNPDDKELKYFQLFDPAVWIIQDGKKFSPIRSDAYFPEWKTVPILDRFFPQKVLQKLDTIVSKCTHAIENFIYL